jgi:hypothetical protein
MMGTKTKILLAGAALTAGLFGAQAVQAAASQDWTSLITTAPGGTLTKVNDVDGENLQDNGGSTPGVVDVGDDIYGALNFLQISQPPSPQTTIGAGTVYSEMTAIFLIKVVSKVDTGTTAGGLEQYNFTFGSDSAAFNTLFGTTAPTGTMIQVYDDYAQNFSLSGGSTPSLTNSINSAKDGALFWNLGFTGAGGAPTSVESWTVTGPDAFAALNSVPFTTSVGSPSAFFVDRTSAAGLGGTMALGHTPSFPTDVAGSSQLLGSQNPATGGDPYPWTATSNSVFSFLALPAPLPSAAWSGLAMLGSLGVASLLRRRARVEV